MECNLISFADFFRHWLEQTQLLKRETLIQLLAQADRSMASSYRNATPLETWWELWSAWYMPQMFPFSSLEWDSITVI